MLLDFGDPIQQEVDLRLEQSISDERGMHGVYGKSRATGGTLRRIGWTRWKDRASGDAAFAISATSETISGTLRIEDGPTGITFDFPDAVVSSAALRMSPATGKIRTVESFSGSCGRGKLIAGGYQNSRIPWDWLWTAWDGCRWNYDGSPYVPVLPVLSPGSIEIVNDGSVQWMEFVFTIPPGWDGQADAGYIDSVTDPSMVIFIEHSTDLGTWTQGVFFDSPSAWTTDAFGWSVVRARSKYILDAKIKSGDLQWKFDTNYIDGTLPVVLDGLFDGATLPISYPYDLNLNSQRSRLQSDLRSAGFSSASVSMASGVVTVFIPGVTLSFGYGVNCNFRTNNRPYYDLYHNVEYYNYYTPTLLSQSAAGYEFRGDIRQFCRLRVSAPPLS